jgi:adenosylhomocysteine nucleosidase
VADTPTVAVLTAMTNELRPVVRLMALTPADAGGGTSHAGTIGRARVVAGITGIGTANATRVTEALLSSTEVDHVVMVGIAGGVDPSVPIGHVVVPDVVIDRASGREHRPVLLDGTSTNGRLMTGDDLLLDPAVLAGLRSQGVVALDMETAAVGAVCDAHGCPWSAFRSISDRPSDGLVDEAVAALARPDGSPDLPGVARYLLRRPWAIAKLARLGRDARTATFAAASAATAACGRQWAAPVD